MRAERLIVPLACFYAFASQISMAVMNIAAGLLLIVGIFSYRKKFLGELSALLKNPLIRWIYYAALALIVTCVGSLIWAKLDPLTYGGKFAEVRLFKDSAKLWYLLFPFMLVPILLQLKSEARVRVFQAWILTLGFLGVIGIIQHYTGWPREQVIPSKMDRFHAVLFLGHHLSVASILIFPFFATLDLFVRKDGPKKIALPRWLLGVVLVLGAVTLFLTFSRMLWISLPLGVLVFALIRLPPKKAILSALGFVVIAGALTQHPAVERRLNTQLGIQSRFDLWKYNFEYFKERPILGVGWRKNYEISGYHQIFITGKLDVFAGHAHNNFMDMLAGTGVLGSVSWLFFCYLIFVLILRVRRHERGLEFATGLLCAWIVFHLNGLTQENFWEGKVTHQMMWTLAWMMVWMREHEPRA